MKNGFKQFLMMFGLLALVVAGLFWKSLVSYDHLQFSNDGPLGVQVASWASDHWNILGCWKDLNWLGEREVSGVVGVEWLIQEMATPAFAMLFIVCLVMSPHWLGRGYSLWRRVGMSALLGFLGYIVIYWMEIAVHEGTTEARICAMWIGIEVVIVTAFVFGKRAGRIEA